MGFLANKKLWLYLILFNLFSLSLLAPIGSILSNYEYLPSNDFRSHTTFTLQAAEAIREGQFPIKTAPFDNYNLRYPEFQFYGVLPFTLAGYCYKYLTHFHFAVLKNPYNTMKLLLWFIITLGGLYAYRFAKLFTQSDILAVLAATAYLFSPYLSNNISGLGDFPAVFALGLLPIALYYSFKIIYFTHFSLLDFIFAAMAWFALLTTHLITFAYGSLFLILAASIFWLVGLSTLKRFCYIAFTIGYVYILAAWFIVPILMIAHHFSITWYVIGTHGDLLGLRPTSIFNLFALKSDASGDSQSAPWFYASIGWPFIFSFLTCLYYLVYPKGSRHSQRYKLSLSVSFLFALALLAAWSGVNFWRYLPLFFSIGQFGHRFLVQIMWLGTIMFILAIQDVFGDKLEAKHFVIGVFLICFAGSSWLIKPPDDVTVSSVLTNPDQHHGDYIVRTDTLPPYPGLQQYGFIQLPLLTVENKLLLERPIQLSRTLLSKDISLVLQGEILSEAKLSNLVISLDGKVIGSRVIKPHDQLNWRVPIGQLFSSFSQPGTTAQLNIYQAPMAFSANKSSVGSYPMLSTKILPIQINKLELISNHITPIPILPLEKVKPFCTQKTEVTECKLTISSPQVAVQLPVLYYPKILSVRMDKKPISYNATFLNLLAVQKHIGYNTLHNWLPFTVTTVIIPAGTHTISIQDTGIQWANMISIIAWMTLIAVFMVQLGRTLCRLKQSPL